MPGLVLWIDCQEFLAGLSQWQKAVKESTYAHSSLKCDSLQSLLSGNLFSRSQVRQTDAAQSNGDHKFEAVLSEVVSHLRMSLSFFDLEI